MSLISDFRERLKVKIDAKKVKKYTYGDINIREDKETGNLEMFLKETLSSSGGRGWSTVRSRKRDTNIRDSKNKIYYTLVVSPSGHFYRREYDDYEQKERYGILYSVPCVLQQILGISLEQAYNMHFTMEELINLIEKINKEKADAIYQFVDLIQYSEDYEGKRILEGLHIARAYGSNLDNFKCIEDEDIEIKLNKNYTLIATKDGKKEMVSGENFKFVSTDILEDVSPGRYYTSLGGYTLEAVQKRVSDYKKEKDNGREEK